MKPFPVLVLLALSVLAFSLDATAFGRRPAEQWAYFHFDGAAFVVGKPSQGEFVAVRDGVLPAVARHERYLKAVKLSAGDGAVAGICYLQSSGGKLGQGRRFLPVPRIPVRISDGEGEVMTVESDSDGYFVAPLPAGSYRVSARETVEVEVIGGKTTLVPLRVGKRMVD